jgi:DNA-binding XRE family transcriptional regulator
MQSESVRNGSYNFRHLFELWRSTMPRKANGAPEHFGARLVALRKRAGYTQTELARELNVTRRMIAYYEGETEFPPSALLPQLTQALGVSLEELSRGIARHATGAQTVKTG